jgi:hypothetical protein
MAAKTANVSAALQHIRELLDLNQLDQALGFIDHFSISSPELKNARGVCLLRQGRLDEAIAQLRDITFQGFSSMPDDAPALFQANFAVAMLLANSKAGAMAIVDRLTGDEHPEAARLKAAVAKWKENIGVLGRFCCRLGFYPESPIPWDEPPGAV